MTPLDVFHREYSNYLHEDQTKWKLETQEHYAKTTDDVSTDVAKNEVWDCPMHGETDQVMRFSVDDEDELVVCLRCWRNDLRERFKNLGKTRRLK